MKNLKDLCVNNSASILTGLGVVGVIGTAVVTAKLNCCIYLMPLLNAVL